MKRGKFSGGAGSLKNIMAESKDALVAPALQVLPTLTGRQAEILAFLNHYFITNRDYPTQREIAEHFAISQNAAALHLVALGKKSYVLRLPGERRNIRLTDLAFEKLRMMGEGAGSQMGFGF